MKRLLLIFLILIVSLWLGTLLKTDPGYLLITINHWSLETTLIIACLALIIFFILFHYTLLLLTKVKNSPTSLHNWWKKRRQQRAQSKTQQGLIEFSEGYWLQAKNHLINALPDLESPLLNYLTAAKAAQEMGDSKLRDDYLREAQQSMPDAKIAVALTQAQLQLANKQWEQALASLKHLQALVPRHPYVLKLLLKLYQEVGDWPQVLILLPELKRHKIITVNEFDKFLQQAYLQLMLNLSKQDDYTTLERVVADLPRKLTTNPDLMELYCRFLLKNNEQAKAELILRQALRKNFHPTLISLYGQITANSDQQLTYAEALLKKFPNSAELSLCLGRLAVANSLWGKAKYYFAKSISLAPTPEAYAQMGQLLERLHEQTAACEAYRQGLFQAVAYHDA